MSLSCCSPLPKQLPSAEGQTKARSLEGIWSPGSSLARFSSFGVGCLVQAGLPAGFNAHWRKTSTSQGRLIPPPGVSFCSVLSMGCVPRCPGSLGHRGQVGTIPTAECQSLARSSLPLPWSHGCAHGCAPTLRSPL